MRNSPRSPDLSPTLLALALATLYTGAAAPARAADTVLAPVVVTAQPLSAANWADTLDSESLATSRAATNDTASLLLGVPGVAVNAAGGVSGLPQINGLADDQLNIQIDGMGLIASCPNHMNPVLSYISPSQVSEITVYPGVAPVSVRSDAIGGAIEVKTAPPQFAEPGKTVAGGEISGGYQSNGNARNIGLSANYGTHSFAIRYDGSLSKANDYSAGDAFKSFAATGRPGVDLGLDVVGSTAYDVRNHVLNMAWRDDDQLLDLTLGYQDVPKQLYPNQRMDMLKNTEKRINLHWQRRFAWGGLDARVYHESVDHFMNFGDDKQYWYSTAPGMPMYTQSHTTGAKVKATIDLTSIDTLRFGADYQRYRLEDWWPPSGTGMMAPGTFYNINDGERDRLGVWGEWQRRLTRQWQMLSGIRLEQVRTNAGPVTGYADTNGMGTKMTYQARDAAALNGIDRERTDHNVDLSLLARYTPSDTFEGSIGLGHSERSPNLYQLYPWSTWAMAAVMNNFLGDGNGYIGNPDLKPEKANTLSATGDWHSADRAWEFKAMPFYTHVSDYIDAEQWKTSPNSAATTLVSGQFVTLKYINQTARLYGLNLSGKMPVASATVAGDFGLEGLVNYTRGRNTDTDDNLYNIMPLNARITLTQKTGGWSNAVEWVLVKAKTNVSAVRNEVPTPGYGLLNLHASYAWKQARVDFGVDNVLDKLYYLPTGGTYVGQGTTMSINGIPWGIAVPGPGRSLYARFSLKF